MSVSGVARMAAALLCSASARSIKSFSEDGGSAVPGPDQQAGGRCPVIWLPELHPGRRGTRRRGRRSASGRRGTRRWGCGAASRETGYPSLSPRPGFNTGRGASNSRVRADREGTEGTEDTEVRIFGFLRPLNPQLSSALCALCALRVLCDFSVRSETGSGGHGAACSCTSFSSGCRCTEDGVAFSIPAQIGMDLSRSSAV